MFTKPTQEQETALRIFTKNFIVELHSKGEALGADEWVDFDGYSINIHDTGTGDEEPRLRVDVYATEVVDGFIVDLTNLGPLLSATEIL